MSKEDGSKIQVDQLGEFVDWSGIKQKVRVTGELEVEFEGIFSGGPQPIPSPDPDPPADPPADPVVVPVPPPAARGWEISQVPMKVCMGGISKSEEMALAKMNGWEWDFNAFVWAPDWEEYLAGAAALGRGVYLSLGKGMRANVDALLEHNLFHDHCLGIEIEAHGTDEWQDADFGYLSNKMTEMGYRDRLYCYQTWFQTPSGTNPIAKAWPHRSKLWYPNYPEVATAAYDDERDVSLSAGGLYVAWNDTERASIDLACPGHELEVGDSVMLRNVDGVACMGQVTESGSETIAIEAIANDATNGVIAKIETGVTTGWTLSFSRRGIQNTMSVRYDLGLYPIRQLANWANAEQGRAVHAWLQLVGQPLERRVYDDHKWPAVALGLGQMMQQLWFAHLSRANIVSYYSARVGDLKNAFINRQHNSRVGYAWDINANGGTHSDKDAKLYRRTWDRVIEAVELYHNGPGYWPSNSDGAWGAENPLVQVSVGGQSETRLANSTR